MSTTVTLNDHDRVILTGLLAHDLERCKANGYIDAMTEVLTLWHKIDSEQAESWAARSTYLIQV